MKKCTLVIIAMVAQTSFCEVVKMTPLPTFIAGTNATLAAANAYTDEHSGAGVSSNVVRRIVEGYGYTNTNAVNDIVQSYGYVTESVTNGLASKAYADDVGNDAKGYTTAVSNKLEQAIASATPGDYYNVSNKAYTAIQSLAPAIGYTTAVSNKLEIAMPDAVASTSVTNGGAKAYADDNFANCDRHGGSYIEFTNLVSFAEGCANFHGLQLTSLGLYVSEETGWKAIKNMGQTLPDYISSVADTKLSRYGSAYEEEGPRINWENGNIKLFGGAKAYFTSDVVFTNWDHLGIGPDAIYKNQTLPQYLASTEWHGDNKTLGDYGITNAIPDVSGMSAEVASISNRQDSLEGYIAGQRVRVSVTNYYGNTSGQLPRLRIEEFITATNEIGGVVTETNYWQTVWDEQNKYDRFLSDATTAIAAMTNNLYKTYYQLLQERLATKAPRAWGTLTSAGEAAPAGSVWHTAPNTVFAGGTEYAHAVVGTGVIGVLTARGAAVYTDGEPGRFHFTTDDKTAYFGMNIASRYELGCATDGITVTQVGGNQMVDLLYNVTMSGKPILYYTPSITNIVWEQITDSSGGAIPGASVYASWDQSAPAGSEICTINCGQGISGFFKASIEYAGVSKFETNMMADLAGGIIATNQTTNQSQPVEPYISSGTVFWRVKQ